MDERIETSDGIFYNVKYIDADTKQIFLILKISPDVFIQYHHRIGIFPLQEKHRMAYI